MTLVLGDRVVKLGRDGQPLKADKESYIVFEVIDLSPTFEQVVERIEEAGVVGQRYAVVQFVKLKKVY